MRIKEYYFTYISVTHKLFCLVSGKKKTFIQGEMKNSIIASRGDLGICSVDPTLRCCCDLKLCGVRCLCFSRYGNAGIR